MIVYNLIGQKIYKNTNIETDDYVLDLKGYPSGTYFLKIIKDAKIETKKIIIK